MRWSSWINRRKWRRRRNWKGWDLEVDHLAPPGAVSVCPEAVINHHRLILQPIGAPRQSMRTFLMKNRLLLYLRRRYIRKFMHILTVYYLNIEVCILMCLMFLFYVIYFVFSCFLMRFVICFDNFVMCFMIYMMCFYDVFYVMMCFMMLMMCFMMYMMCLGAPLDRNRTSCRKFCEHKAFDKYVIYDIYVIKTTFMS